MDLKELKAKTPVELLAYAEELEVENASYTRADVRYFKANRRNGNSTVW